MASTGRILYVGTLPPHRGGSGVWAGTLLPRLAARGFAIQAIAPLDPADRAVAERSLALHPAIQVTRVEARGTDPLDRAVDGFRPRQAGMIERALRYGRSDILLTGKEPFALGAAGPVRTHGKPWVAMVHRDLGHDAAHAKGQRALEELLADLRHADLVITVAERAAASLVGLGLRSVAMIPNGVDTVRFCPAAKPIDLGADLGLGDGDLIVGHFSNLRPIKRPMDIVDAAAIATRSQPSLRFLMVGDGVGRDALEQACRDRGIEGFFRFTGWIDHDRVADYVRLTDLVAMPSESEARSFAWLETMACGRVLLASDIPAAREIVDHGRTGFLHGVGDVEALAALMVQLAADPERRHKVGRAAREEVALRHGLEAAAARYAELLGDLCRR